MQQPLPPPSPPDRRTGAGLNALLAALIALSLLVLVSLVLIDASEEVGSGSQSWEIIFFKPRIIAAMHWALAGSFLVLLAGGIYGLIRRRVLLPVLALVTALVLMPTGLVLRFIRTPVDWTLHDTLTAPDGTRYAFLDYSFLQGQTMALAEVTADGPVRMTCRVIGTNNGDWPRSWTPVVRPATQAHEGYGQLYLSPAGVLVGIRYRNRCFLAYDRKTGRFFGHGDVETISPFVLIGPSTRMYPPDVTALLAAVKTPAQEGEGGRVNPDRLREALQHPNGEVRKLARKLLQAMSSAPATAPQAEPTGPPPRVTTDRARDDLRNPPRGRVGKIAAGKAKGRIEVMP